jgi:hypothetical protein
MNEFNKHDYCFDDPYLTGLHSHQSNEIFLEHENWFNLLSE